MVLPLRNTYRRCFAFAICHRSSRQFSVVNTHETQSFFDDFDIRRVMTISRICAAAISRCRCWQARRAVGQVVAAVVLASVGVIRDP